MTIRVWNWESRTCILTLTGHNHYIMSAKWFVNINYNTILKPPMQNNRHSNKNEKNQNKMEEQKTEEISINDNDNNNVNKYMQKNKTMINSMSHKDRLYQALHNYKFVDSDMLDQPCIVSASLDRTIRLWNFQEHFDNPSNFHIEPFIANDDNTKCFQCINRCCHNHRQNMHVFDVIEGNKHTKGVNDIDFHRLSDCVVSSSDDFTIKTWNFRGFCLLFFLFLFCLFCIVFAFFCFFFGNTRVLM